MTQIAQNTGTRLSSIDAWRGFVMVFMALDHVRDFFTSYSFDPADLNHTSGMLFFTRIITHLCAPIFFFSIGTSMSLSLLRGKTIKDISFFLFTRGIWIIIVGCTIGHFTWKFNFDLSYQELGVLWVIGCAMIVLSGLVYLPKWLILIFGLTLVFGHNLLDHKDHILGVFSVLHSPAKITYQNGLTVYWHYLLIPWIGVPALGFVFGSIYSLRENEQIKWITLLGLFTIVLFVVLRFINIYGDPLPWSVQKDSIFTIMSFLSVNKYPPSLLYLLMTMGPAFLLLVAFQKSKGFIVNKLAIFGKVPFFFFLIHVTVIHLFAVITAYILHKPIDPFFTNEYGDLGFLGGLWATYLVWFIVIIALFPLCRWYAEFKKNHQANTILRYL